MATSNRPPTALYEGGLQREAFLPFVAKLVMECEILEMAAGVDYRLEGRVGKRSYFLADADTPSDGKGEPQSPELEEIWDALVASSGGIMATTTTTTMLLL